jgi:hypothetical protein
MTERKIALAEAGMRPVRAQGRIGGPDYRRRAAVAARLNAITDWARREGALYQPAFIKQLRVSKIQRKVLAAVLTWQGEVTVDLRPRYEGAQMTAADMAGLIGCKVNSTYAAMRALTERGYLERARAEVGKGPSAYRVDLTFCLSEAWESGGRQAAARRRASAGRPSPRRA